MKNHLNYGQKILIILFSIFFLLSCSSNNKTNKEVGIKSTNQELIPKYKLLAKEKFQGDLEYIPNSNNTYILCISHNKPTNEIPFPSFNYFIYDIINDEIIYEDTHENGNVNWKNNEQIMIHTFPGQIRNDNDQPIVYIYDIKKKKKYIDEIIKDK